jgi:hypothetical protein
MADLVKKPSFFGSMMNGITGTVKGTLAGGAVGIITGAAIGAIAGLATGGLALAAVAGAAVTGAMIGGAALALIGSAAGMVTGVVRHREAAQPSAQDVVSVAKVSFAQGVSVGHNIGHEHASTAFRDREAQRRAAAAAQSQQIH